MYEFYGFVPRKRDIQRLLRRNYDHFTGTRNLETAGLDEKESRSEFALHYQLPVSIGETVFWSLVLTTIKDTVCCGNATLVRSPFDQRRSEIRLIV